MKKIMHTQFCAGIAVGCLFLHPSALAAPITGVNLGSAANFVILAGAGITVAGAVNTTTITGDIGAFPTSTITGLGNVVLNGVNHSGDAVTQNAKSDLVAAYNDAAGRPATLAFGPVQELGGLTLSTGVYSGASSFGLTGTLTLNALGDPNAVWIFQAGSALTTGSGSNVLLIGGAQACNVFWEIGSSATLGTNSYFVGNILALTSITMTTGATLDGRLLARNGTVTLDTNTIVASECLVAAGVPDSGRTILLLALALGALLVFGGKKRFTVGHAG